MTDVSVRLNCRLCLHGDLRSVFKLPDTPLANEFVTEKREQKKYPLEVVQCAACGHSQLRHVVDPKLMFSNYAYVSGTSPSFVRHFEEYAGRAHSTWLNLPGPRPYHSGFPLAIDVGSNDGVLVHEFQKMGWRALGVEPAANLAEAANKERRHTLNAFFTEDVAKSIVEDHGEAAVVTANNVFAHIDDLDEVVRGVKRLLLPDGISIFEVQYLGDLLKSGAFDLIYAEHCSYHALFPLVHFFRRHDLHVFDAERVPTHGGSLRVWVCRPGRLERAPRTDALLREEEPPGLIDEHTWKPLAAKVEKTKTELRTILDTFKARKANIVAYGAPAKLTTFCYGLGLTADDFDYVVDDSPLKQGKYTPGLNIPVLPPSALIDTTRGWPDLIVLTAWNFAESILAKLRPLMDGGANVLVPFPEIKVYP